MPCPSEAFGEGGKARIQIPVIARARPKPAGGGGRSQQATWQSRLVSFLSIAKKLTISIGSNRSEPFKFGEV
ncbi:MAG: hypothetical protein A2599_02455 [Candidatus Staskawiczbacteria bacterium RIFOXYD1_FULL_39_28]|uniref:Uncharacterized protein n=1 Tax=Candidatus Staskawiczbacteria bacterium RIFOXYC1_FULL_38_18 TaxID=1802229 RepID=A0A1G2JDB5_9BACT|nr:MAG: hypothetical protein A2401_01815 [Candidatus Staskawiczbacteria bacterium RIFOXYC1_FULL_38_18]OGZ90520.1 MAG: hypothetical protein A2599_02455 [Candidatus Staskawiczbacteria bacterium RIFOXYD1_FULL_39_28]